MLHVLHIEEQLQLPVPLSFILAGVLLLDLS